MSEPKTYINIPVTEAEEARIRASDKFWDGPKLSAVVILTLGFAFTILFLSSQHILGPSMPEETFAPGALTGH
ncbi:MAG: hypothetical protein AAF411_22195 [Myxococcota bacterium]